MEGTRTGLRLRDSTRKPGICSNTAALPIEAACALVLDLLEDRVLHPDFVDYIVHRVLAAPSVEEERARLEAERDWLRTSIQKLVALVATGGVEPETVAPQIRDRETDLRRVATALRAVPTDAPDADALRAALLQQTAEWRSSLRAKPDVARLLVRTLLEPLRFLGVEPEEPDFLVFEARPKLDWLRGVALVGFGAEPSVLVASPAGFEPAF